VSTKKTWLKEREAAGGAGRETDRQTDRETESKDSKLGENTGWRKLFVFEGGADS
jgi:hypothetical protein